MILFDLVFDFFSIAYIGFLEFLFSSITVYILYILVSHL